MQNKMNAEEELTKALKAQNLVYGRDETVKKLRLGKIKRIFLARNLPDIIKEDINHYASLADVEVFQLSVDNDELGVKCKKPFSVAVLATIE